MTSSPLLFRHSDLLHLSPSGDQLANIMEEIQQRHRKEAKDLQARITQKKKAATKKTRKGVNDECDNLERELKARHAAELHQMTAPDSDQDQDQDKDKDQDPDELVDRAEGLTIGQEDKTEPPTHPQPTSSAPPHPPLAPEPKKKQNRAKARLARRAAEQEALAASAAEEAQDIPNFKAIERESMLKQFSTRSLSEREIRADGHCLYSAVADQLEQLGMPLGTAPSPTPDIAATLEPYKLVRQAAAEYIESHPNDFAPFLEEPLDYYAYKIKNTAEWGGQLELMALAKKYGVAISVLQGDGRVEEINPQGDASDKQVWLAYYRHGFGLGEHYNSLRKAG